jgi:large subunit ribosomal protein L20
MARVKRGVTARKKHKKILSYTKGFKHGRKNIFRLAKQAWIRAGQYAYRDRRNKKRSLRGQWIIVINAAARENGLTYAQFMNGLRRMEVDLNRKVLSTFAREDMEKFKELVEKAKEGLKKAAVQGAKVVEKTLETADSSRAEAGKINEKPAKEETKAVTKEKSAEPASSAGKKTAAKKVAPKKATPKAKKATPKKK